MNSYRHDPDEEDSVADQDSANRYGVGKQLQALVLCDRLCHEGAAKHAGVHLVPLLPVLLVIQDDHLRLCVAVDKQSPHQS